MVAVLAACRVLGLEYLVIFCTIPLQVSGKISSIGTCPNIKQMLP